VAGEAVERARFRLRKAYGATGSEAVVNKEMLLPSAFGRGYALSGAGFGSRDFLFEVG
jgi:hypothetical protein